MLPKDLIKKIKKLEIVTRRLVNEQLAGQYHSVFRGRGMDFDEVRPYQPGDDIRRIDWNVSARTGEVHVKHFVEERELTVFLLVDASASLNFGSLTQRKRDTAAEIGALLAFSAIKNNDRVGLLMFTDEVELIVPPKKGRKHVMRIISELLRYKPSGAGTNLTEALDTLGRITRRKSVVFVMSDFIGEDYERGLRVMSRRHDVIPVIIVDPMEEKLPDMGVCTFEDPETGDLLVVDTSSRSVRATYQERAAALKSRRETTLRRSNIDFISIYTHQPYLQPLIRYFKLRASRY
ncbi:MAG: hypothetical protein AUK47_11250 [Deltaproteobacteria bacterium CG2_30_63_29]|nr:MAG: hypothetical protein AUK47_11250 [Deltaproteobacteria bacterium CG2_30_63_29]PIV98076.1 MAG: DUF58 domain-containing protein [Deltaproteobacteria bacterium CG17_big_fil_post_rev_8_21_14_2_50_63_7]PJB36388.1 MAG: DUF58 domain-containing protein [Deltaproteobacteria bacterium CG_4_9_14_3_um_filter_63_12]